MEKDEGTDLKTANYDIYILHHAKTKQNIPLFLPVFRPRRTQKQPSCVCNLLASQFNGPSHRSITPKLSIICCVVMLHEHGGATQSVEDTG